MNSTIVGERRCSARCGSSSGNSTAIRCCWPCRATTICNGPTAKISAARAVRLAEERLDGFQEIAEKFWDEGDIRSIATRSAECSPTIAKWWATRPHCAERRRSIDAGLLPGDFSTTFVTDGGHKIGILGLNTTFLQLGDEIKERPFGLRSTAVPSAPARVAMAWSGRGVHDVCLLMTHQGPEWLDEPSRKKEYPAINLPGRFAVHLFGHMHEEMLRGFSQRRRTIWSAGGKAVRCSAWNTTATRTRKIAGTGIRRGRSRFDGDHVFLRHWPRRRYARRGERLAIRAGR